MKLLLPIFFLLVAFTPIDKDPPKKEDSKAYLKFKDVLENPERIYVLQIKGSKNHILCTNIRYRQGVVSVQNVELIDGQVIVKDGVTGYAIDKIERIDLLKKEESKKD